MSNFEYLAYDAGNNFSVIRKRFETLEAAQQYKLDNMATHSSPTIRFAADDTTGTESDDTSITPTPTQPDSF